MSLIAISRQPVHKALVVYALLSIVYYIVATPVPIFDWSLIWPRLALVVYLTVWASLNKAGHNWLPVVDIAVVIAFLGVFYGETATINQYGFVWDGHLVRWEQQLFGTQPSLIFAERWPNILFVELMNLGYFSYYLMMIGLPLWVYSYNKHAFAKHFFIIVVSFLTYYAFFCLFKSVGPQYYFTAPQNLAPEGWLFAKLIKFIQYIGEVPTGAFPSSHVGMALIFAYLTLLNAKPLLKWMVPFILLLMASTVYIRAHYVVDVIGGIVSAPIVYLLSTAVWNLIQRKEIT
jgi:membrane-associated phospholipid phosphatase